MTQNAILTRDLDMGELSGPTFAKEYARRARHSIRQVFLGNDHVIEALLWCLAIDRHLLIEGPPGEGKTLLSKGLRNLYFDGLYWRFDMTETTLPIHLIGYPVPHRKEDGTVVNMPVFSGITNCHVFHADEFNQAPPDAIRSLNPALDEYLVTVAGIAQPLLRPFTCIATMNPGAAGTFAFDGATWDRFPVAVKTRRLRGNDNVRGLMVDTNLQRSLATNKPALRIADTLKLQEIVREHVPRVPECQREWADRFACYTDPREPEFKKVRLESEDEVERDLFGSSDGKLFASMGLVKGGGLSNRGVGMWMQIATARALFEGRSGSGVTRDDLIATMSAVMEHRLPMSASARAEGITSYHLLRAVRKLCK